MSCNKFHWESAEKHILKDPKLMILLYLKAHKVKPKVATTSAVLLQPED